MRLGSRSAGALLGIAFGSYWMSNVCVVHAHSRLSAGRMGLRFATALPDAERGSAASTGHATRAICKPSSHTAQPGRLRADDEREVSYGNSTSTLPRSLGCCAAHL